LFLYCDYVQLGATFQEEHHDAVGLPREKFSRISVSHKPVNSEQHTSRVSGRVRVILVVLVVLVVQSYY
jgi:hypothetical protein